jgi:hypothetical protein
MFSFMKKILTIYSTIPNKHKKNLKKMVREWLMEAMKDRYDDIIVQSGDGMTSFVVPTPYADMLAEYVVQVVKTLKFA